MSTHLRRKSFDRYACYEASVQTPDVHIEWLDTMAKEIRGREYLHLREDFCGTFVLAAEWVKTRKDRTAIGLDLDPVPLNYGMEKHYSRLNRSQRQRLKILRKDVRTVTRPAPDLVLAGNFSFNIFFQRADLKKYFEAVYRSLSPQKGAFVLELAGGPGMIRTGREQRQFRLPRSPKSRKYTYYWDQQSFDPIHQIGRYAIHFKTPEGEMMRNAFIYEWRLWNMPELRDLLHEVGFTQTVVYWEQSEDGKSTGIYRQSEKGDNAYSWVAYLIGIKG